MKLLATTANASINTQPLEAISQEGGKSNAESKSLWERILARFWAYTEETGKADTKSFEGLL